MVRANWTGAPQTTPSIYVSTSGDNATVQTHVSWNGDSRVTQWRVYASQDNTSSSDPMAFDKAGFETMYEFQLDWPTEVNSLNVWAEGVNASGEVVGTSRQVMIQKEGQGGAVSEQSGVGNTEVAGNGTSTNGTDTSGSGSDGNSGSNSSDNSNGASLAKSGLSWSVVLVGTGAVALYIV
jgi:hypothetical protein